MTIAPARTATRVRSRYGTSIGVGRDPADAAVTPIVNRDTGFRLLIEQIDTSTSVGKLIFHAFGALAEFERDLTRERTNAGLAAARARGRTGGRPKKLADPKTLALAQALYDGEQTDIETICRTLGISRATLYRTLERSPRHRGRGVDPIAKD